MNIYRLTVRNHISQLTHLIGFFVVFTILVLFYLLVLNSSLTILYFSTIFLTYHSIITLSMHYNYYNVNKDDELQYDNVNRLFVFKHLGEIKKYKVDDIGQVVMYKSYALHNKRAKFLAWDEYYYSVIQMVSGEKIILSSLLLNGDFPLSVDDDKIVVKQSIYKNRWIRGESYQK